MSNQTTKKNIHDGHRGRVRENVLKNGFEQLEDHRLLELLLFYSIPRGDTNELAHRLLNEFGSLSGVIKASPEALTKVLGVGESSAIQLSAIGELCMRAIKEGPVKKTAYKDDKEIIELVKSQYFNEENERLLLVCFDNIMRLKHLEFISEGNAVTTDLDVKKILSRALAYDTKFVVIAHNHPDGPAFPSGADIDTTASLSVTLRKIDLILNDHIILGSDSVYSMRVDSKYSQMFG